MVRRRKVRRRKEREKRNGTQKKRESKMEAIRKNERE